MAKPTEAKDSNVQSASASWPMWRTERKIRWNYGPCLVLIFKLLPALARPQDAELVDGLFAVTWSRATRRARRIRWATFRSFGGGVSRRSARQVSAPMVPGQSRPSISQNVFTCLEPRLRPSHLHCIETEPRRIWPLLGDIYRLLCKHTNKKAATTTIAQMM